MRRIGPAVVLAALIIGSATSALAGVLGVINTVVSPRITPITYSDPAANLKMLVGYDVTITNTGSNTVNKVTFTGTTVVGAMVAGAFQATAQEKATYDSSNALSGCVTTSADKTSISCLLGTLNAGTSFKFTVAFVAPTKANPPVGDAVYFSGVTLYSETTKGGAPSPKNSQNYWGGSGDPSNPSPVPLGTANPTNVISLVSPSGGTVFTQTAGGCGAFLSTATTTCPYPLGTLVNVPSTNTYTTATINQIQSVSIDPNSGSTCSSLYFYACWSTQLTIPGTFDYLTIVLRQNKSNIKPNATPNLVTIQYTGDDGTVTLLSLSQNVCSNINGVPQPPPVGTFTPCLATGGVESSSGDYVFTLFNRKNGSYRVF